MALGEGVNTPMDLPLCSGSAARWTEAISTPERTQDQEFKSSSRLPFQEQRVKCTQVPAASGSHWPGWG